MVTLRSDDSPCYPGTLLNIAWGKARNERSWILPQRMGTLYYGECVHTATIDIRHRYINDETIDLVYLDPPFNSAANYNAFFQEKE